MRIDNEMYRRIVEAVPEGIWVVDPQGLTIFNNRRMAEILGVGYESMPGQSCFDCVFPDELADAQQLFARTLGGDLRPFDFRLRRADGSPIWVSISAMPVYDDAGTTVGMLGLFADITERRQAGAALRESEERFRNMADSAPVLIWLTGPDKVLSFFNKTWLDFVGRALEQELNSGWVQNVHPDDVDQCFASYSAAFDARQRFHIECRLRRAALPAISVPISTSPISGGRRTRRWPDRSWRAWGRWPAALRTTSITCWALCSRKRSWRWRNLRPDHIPTKS